MKTALAAVRSRLAGLSEGEAAEGLRRFGPNALAQQRRTPVLALLAAQLRHVLVLVLLPRRFVADPRPGAVRPAG